MTVTHHTSHSLSYLSSLPLVTDPIAVASNDCARDRLHKDHCAQAFGRNTLSKPHSVLDLLTIVGFSASLSLSPIAFALLDLPTCTTTIAFRFSNIYLLKLLTTLIVVALGEVTADNVHVGHRNLHVGVLF